MMNRLRVCDVVTENVHLSLVVSNGNISHPLKNSFAGSRPNARDTEICRLLSPLVSDSSPSRSALGSKSMYTLEPGHSVVSAATAAFAFSTWDMKSSQIGCFRRMLSCTTNGSTSLSGETTSPLSLKVASEYESISTVGEVVASLEATSAEMVMDTMQAKERHGDSEAPSIREKGMLRRIPSTSSVGSKTARRFRRCKKIAPTTGRIVHFKRSRGVGE